MAHKAMLAVFATILAASPLAAQPDPGPTTAPAGGPTTLYCMRVTLTGNVSDVVRCWTRDEWADQGVDVDRDWAANGVRTIG